MSIEKMSTPLREDLQSVCEICEHNLDPLMNNHGRCGVNNERYMQAKTSEDCGDFAFMKMEDE